VVALAVGAVSVTIGAAVEISRVRSLGSQLQDTTDAAALHSVRVAVQGGDSAEVTAAARSFVLANFASKAGSTPDVTATVVSSSPVRVRVEATSTLPLVFGGVVGQPASDVTRAALAEAKQVPICVLLLEPSAAQTWSAGGSSRVIGDGCSAQVNSTSSGALSSNGGAGATMDSIKVGGSVGTPSGFNPRPTSNQPAMQDPIAPRVSWPAATTCAPARTNLNVTSPLALTAGAYCGGITIGNGGVVTLGPGVHVIQSGDLTVKSGGKLLAPVGASVVLTGDASTVNILAGGSADIRAPKTGAWRGIAVAQKPQSTQRTSNMQGGGALLFDGIIYLPTQKLHLTGGGDLSVSGLRRVFIARTLETAGNGKVFVSGSPDLLVETAQVRLVE
jgi:hypothetical protein